MDSLNDDITFKIMEEAQEDHNKDIVAIMDKVGDEASEILSETSDEDEAAKSFAEVIKDAKDDIKKVNEKHDKEVIETTKNALVADLQNDVA